MKRVYIAGKLNADAVGYLQNVSLMVKEGIKLHKKGYAVLIPCLDLIAGIVAGNWDYKDYAETNMAWLEVADEVHVLPNWETSEGTKKEIIRARELKIPIKFL